MCMVYIAMFQKMSLTTNTKLSQVYKALLSFSKLNTPKYLSARIVTIPHIQYTVYH